MADNPFEQFRGVSSPSPSANSDNPFASFAARPRPSSGVSDSPPVAKRPTRTWGEAAKDTGLGVAQGAVNLIGGVLESRANTAPGALVRQGLRVAGKLGVPGTDAIADAVPRSMTERMLGRPAGSDAQAISSAVGGVTEAITGAKSESLQQRQRELAETKGVWPTIKKVATDPQLLGNFAAEQVPNLATLGTGTRVAMARGAAGALERGLASGLTREAAEAAAQKAGVHSAEATNVALTALTESGSAGQQAYQDAMQQPDSVWQANPEYQRMIARGVDPVTAKETIARGASMTAQAITAPIAAAAGKVAAPFETEVFTRGLARRPTAVLQGMAKEATEETIQEGAGQLAQNIGVQQLDPNRETWDGVGEAAATGGTLGAVMGGVLGAGGVAVSNGERIARRPTAEPPPLPPEQRALPAPDGTPQYGVNIVSPGGTVITPEQRGLDPRVTGEPARPAPNPAARPGVRVADDSLNQQPLARRPQPVPAGAMVRAARPNIQSVEPAAPRFAGAAPGSMSDAANLLPTRPAVRTAQSEEPAPAPAAIDAPTAPAVPAPWVDETTGEVSREPSDEDIKQLLHANLEYQAQNVNGISSPRAEKAMRDQYGLPSSRVRPLLEQVKRERKMGITSVEPEPTEQMMQDHLDGEQALQERASAPPEQTTAPIDARAQAPTPAPQAAEANAEVDDSAQAGRPNVGAIYAEEYRRASPEAAAEREQAGRSLATSEDAVRLSSAIGMKDVKTLRKLGIENSANKATRATFSRATGVELPASRKGTADALRAWAADTGANIDQGTGNVEGDGRADSAEAVAPARPGEPAAGEAVPSGDALPDGRAAASEPDPGVRTGVPDGSPPPDAQPALSERQTSTTPPTGGVSASGAERFPRVDAQEVHHFGLAAIRPQVVAPGKTLHREMSTDNLDSLLYDDRGYSTSRFHVTDDADLAIGQGANRGAQVTFRPDSISGRENAKPGTGIVGGREYQTDLVAPRAVATITMAKEDVRKLRGVSRVVLGQEFDRTNLDDGRVRYTRKGLQSAPVQENASVPPADAAPARENAPEQPVDAAPATVKEAAAQAATSPDNDLPDATPAQREAGNFKVGRLKLSGLDISIEYPAGVKRKPGHKALTRAYGYFRGTVGRDKDHVDVFLGEHADNPDLPVFVIDQLDQAGKFDEHKVILGEETEAAARDAYLSNYPDDWTGLGGITEMTQEQFKAWVQDQEKTKRRLTRAPRAAAATEASKPAPAAPATQLNDVGEKIGGARKDQWKERGLRLTDLDAMTGGEQAMYAVKANVWKPDYAGMVSEGMDPQAASLAKAVWDKVPAKPAQDTEEGRRHYVEALNIAREVLEAARTVQDVENAGDAFRARAVPKGVGRLANMPAIRLHAPVYGAAMRAAGRRAWPFGTLSGTDRRAAQQRVAGGWPGEATWKSAYGVGQWSTRQADGQMARRWMIERTRRGDGMAAGTIAGDRAGYATPEEAVAAAEALFKARAAEPVTKAPRTKEPPRPHLDNVPRTGEDYRQGKDVAAEDFRQAFGFRGVEFGNWAAQDERQKLVNLAYDGLMDMANVLGIPPAAVSLDGTLGLALGARGAGGAAAHYEPGKVVINMTKINGAGALAHEWGHALDHYFGEFGQDNAYSGRGRFISGGRGAATYNNSEPFQKLRPEMQEGWRGVLKAIYQKAVPQAEYARGLELRAEQMQAQLQALPKLTDKADALAVSQRAVLETRIKSVERELEFVRSQPADATWAGGPSDQAVKSNAMGAYWKRPTEMLARAFEAYVQGKIQAEGNRSQYLASVPADPAWPLPGEELKRVSRAFDKLFAAMQTRQTERGTALFSLADDAQTETPAFKRWFEGSKVVDDAGKPMVVFHGTNEDFDVFDIDRAGEASGFSDWGDGFYFTDARDAAEGYADDPNTGRVLQAYLDIKNPATNEVMLSPEIQQVLSDDMGFVSVQEALEAKGYDGIQFTHKDGKREFVAFRPEQVKSATDNNGDFDATNPSMLFSVGEGRGLSMNRALQLKRDLTAKWGENAPNVVVVENAEGFPADARVDPNYTRAEGFYNGSPTVYINAGRISSEERFAQVLAHEALGHFGVESIVGQANWRGIADAVARLESTGTGGEQTRAVLADVRRRYGDIDRDTFAKEVIAVMAERGIQNGLVNRVIAAARRWLRRMMPSLQWSEADVRDLLGQADSFLHAGQTNEERAALVRAYAFSQGERPAPLRPDSSEAEKFRKDFDRIVPSAKTIVPPITIGRTPAVLRALGAQDLPITISRDTIRKASNGVKHNVPRAELRKLPEQLADPLAVFKSKTEQNALVALTELQDASGRPVVVALDLRAQGQQYRVNRVSSVYGKDGAAPFVSWANQLAYQSERAAKSPVLEGVYSPNRISGDGDPTSGTVLTESDVVNPEPTTGAGGIQSGPAARLFSLPGDTALEEIDAVQAAAQPEGIVARARQMLKDAVPAKLKDATRPKWLSVLTTRHLTELGSDYFKGITHFSDYLTQMQADRNTLQEQAEKIAEGTRQWAGKHRAEAQRMFDLMHEATIEGVDPAEGYKPLQFRLGGILQEVNQKNVAHAILVIREQMKGRSGDSKKNMLEEVKSLNAMRKAEPRRKRAYGPLVDRWNQMSPEAKANYIQMRDAYQERSKAVEEALVQRIKDLKGDGVSDHQVQVMVTKIRQQFESNRLQGVYFPLQRFGNFFVSAGKGQASTFLMFPSLNELDRAVKDLKAKGWVINAQGRKNDGKAKDAPPGSFVADVINELKKAHVSDATQDAVYQVYLQALPELSMRKHQIHRKAIPGFDRDALRAFAFSMHHGSHQLARLRYAHKLSGIVDMLQKNQDAKRREPDADTRKIAAGDAVLSELARRHEWIMNPTDNQLTNLVSSAGFVYYLGATPAAALVNLTQTALVSYPYLAARHGGVKAMNALLAASKDAIRTVGNIQRTLTDPEEQRAHAALLASGALDKTQAHNLAGIAEGGLQGYNPAWSKAMEIIGWGFHKTEVVNREATGLAAFRLARANGESFDAAVRFAHDTIFDTHFDYSNANRARFMQGGAAKVLLMFRQYGLNMSWMLGRAVWQATKGESPEVKRIARRNLAGILGMSSLFSGVLGLPMASVVTGVLNSLQASFGDDDEPWDAETEFAAFLSDMFGPEAAQVVLHGGVNAITGADIAGRTGLSDLWFRDADRELEGRGYYYSLLEQAAGPMGGVLKNAIVGKNLIDEGHTWRGIETMLPKSLRDMVKAGRYAVQGATTLRGDPLLADTSVFDVVMQGTGFTPAAISRQYERNNALMNYQDHIVKRRQHLMDAFAMSMRLGDTEARAATLQKIRAFNQTNPELAITSQGLRTSLQSRARYSARAEAGIVLNPKLASRLRAAVDGGG